MTAHQKHAFTAAQYNSAMWYGIARDAMANNQRGAAKRAQAIAAHWSDLCLSWLEYFA